MTTEVLRIGRRLRVDQPAAGELHLSVSEWAGAPWVAVPLALMTAPLVVWAAFEGHLIEFGGGLVGCWFAGLAAWLWMRGRREVVLRRTDGGIDVHAVEGAGPLRKVVDRAFEGEPRLELHEPPAPDDAPPTADPGTDLVLVCDSGSLHLVRLFGPPSARLTAEHGRLVAALGTAARSLSE